MSFNLKVKLTTLFFALFFFMNAKLKSQEYLVKDAKIVFLGDSITQSGAQPGGYVTIFDQIVQEKFRELDIEVIGAGISGNKVPQLLSRLDKDVLEKNPTTVVIYIGINDVWHSEKGQGTPIENFESGLIELCEKIQASGSKVVLCTPSVIGESQSNSLDQALDRYSEVMRSLAAKFNIKLIDLRQQFVDFLKSNNPLDRDKNILTSDGVHLNAAGNDFVAEKMLTALGCDYKASKANQVMRHIVLFQFKESVSETEIDEIAKAFGQLPDSIDQIIGYEAGTNVSPENLDQGFTHAFVVTFRDAKGRDEYLPHPAHKEFVKKLDGKIEKVLVFDFEN
ncbi:MAG: GDSL-type esterase/lipase family protein [Planctomycetota bacterium]